MLGDLGIGGVGFSPLAQGMLTDKYLDGIPADSRAAAGTSLSPDLISADNVARLRGLNDIAAARGQSLAQLALAWALRDPRVTSLVIGASSVAQLRANVAAVSRYQRGVWARQLATEAATRQPFVSDRGPDNLAYLALHGTGVADIIESREFVAAMAAMRRSVVFLVRPHNGVVPADGIRPAADTLRDSQMRIDGAVTLLLKAWRVDPVPLSGEPADQELVIASVLEAHGFRPVAV